jgi:hypothetical protein
METGSSVPGMNLNLLHSSAPYVAKDVKTSQDVLISTLIVGRPLWNF